MRLFTIFVKSDGPSLNLTATDPIFSFDRGWKPAVENRETGQAFPIVRERDHKDHQVLWVGTNEETNHKDIEIQ